jgi:hypothetical protein
MRLTTIWTLRGMPLRERLGRTGEWIVQTIAHRLPRRLAYWSFIDSTARYSSRNPNAIVPSIAAIDVIAEFPGVPE